MCVIDISIFHLLVVGKATLMQPRLLRRPGGIATKYSITLFVSFSVLKALNNLTAPSTMALCRGTVDQRACAFLTKLPSETRNTIYEYIFKHHDPIYVARSRWYKEEFKLHRRRGDQNEGLLHSGNFY